jgi:hypothetical protein
MKSDWDERNKYCDPFIEWNEYKDAKERVIKESNKEN